MSSKNMFALLNSSDSDDEAPKKQQAKPAAAAPAAKPAKTERKPRNDRRDDRPRAEGEGRQNYDGDKNNSNDRREGGKGGRREYNDRSKGKGENRGKGGSRGDSGREYPRRSGTGRGREGSRQGSGKYNWGKDTDGAAAPTETAEPVEGAEPAADGAEAPAPEVIVEEEDTTIGFDEWEKAQAEKMAALNSLNTYHEHTVEVDDDVCEKEEKAIEDEYECMFHTRDWSKKDHGRKQARDGYKQADQVLNLKFVDENADSGKGKGSGKGDRRQGAKGGRGPKGGRDFAGQQQGKSIDLSNDSAFPTLA